ncbi:MAG TPA: tetratricopeptide repeat protein [Thermoanaerobaculia bacterium]|nr:tetratricopeptide repeat protein [Thermoanaerobaculia bacterium]
MPRTPKDIDNAINAVLMEDYLRALTLFVEIYGTEDSPPIQSPRDGMGLSYFGLVLALVQKKYKIAVDLCKRAIDLEFYNGDHYANLARVYLAAGNRKKAVQTAEAGLRLVPGHEDLMEVRRELGVRSRPAVPFLDRTNPVNVSLGQVRHAKKEVGRDDPARPSKKR